jgi:hypothetical protein
MKQILMLVDEKPQCCADCLMYHEAFEAGDNDYTFELVYECFLLRQKIEDDNGVLSQCPLIEFKNKLMVMED